jgi:hypothetical protein
MKLSMIFEEYDCIQCAEEFDETVPISALGTILLILSKEPPVYEVEFFDNCKKSIGYFTVEEKFLIKRDLSL